MSPHPRTPATSRTATVRAGLERDAQFGAVVPPLHLSSNFTFRGLGQPRAHDYTRSGNPTRDLLADALTELEGGAGAVVTASGMGAATCALQLLDPGDLLLAPHDCYGGTHRLLRTLAAKGAFQVDFVELHDPAVVAGIAARRPAMVWVETPSNPLLRITDIEAVVASARRCEATVLVDNTFLSPVLQRPLDLGADIVLHSTTKYLNGHSDVVGGALVAADAEVAERLCWWANCLGLTGAPFDSFLTLRGLRTLHARWRAHAENTHAVVAALHGHPPVTALHWPGLVEHPGHTLAARQQQGFGAMLSFELAGGQAAVAAFVEGLRCFSLAESLGGVESLVAHPASMTHAAMTPEARAVAGIGDGLLRLSIGIESPDDLVADLREGLRRAGRVGRPVERAAAGC